MIQLVGSRNYDVPLIKTLQKAKPSALDAFLSETVHPEELLTCGAGRLLTRSPETWGGLAGPWMC